MGDPLTRVDGGDTLMTEDHLEVHPECDTD